MWIVGTTALALALTPAQVQRARPGAWISDGANVIEASDEAKINARLDALKRETGVEIAVVTVPSVTDGTPKQFATELFNLWGIGSAERDDGLLVFLAVEQRRLEMETGYGLEGTLPDGWLGVMQSQRMVPLFKKGDFGGGIDAGLVAVEARLRGGQAPPISGGRVVRVSPREASALDPTLVVLGSLVLFGVVALVLVVVWKRRRTCPTCAIPMHPLPESEEDAHLSDGQEREEQLGSVRWDVYQCPTCAHTRTFGHRALFSGYSKCPSCTFRTRTSKQVTTSHPTRYSTGSATVTEDCKHCSYHTSYSVTLAALPDPSTTSSSSGGSFGGGGGGGGFGGGSSGGGGAGSSW